MSLQKTPYMYFASVSIIRKRGVFTALEKYFKVSDVRSEVDIHIIYSYNIGSVHITKSDVDICDVTLVIIEKGRVQDIYGHIIEENA